MKNGVDLGSGYEATLGRIKAQGGEKARLRMAALMWIAHSRRPLQVDEICHAIAIRIGSNDLDIDDIPAISTLLGCCQGLVTMDQGSSTVRLIHFTLQEYLCVHPDLFDRAHSTMAETCLTYLNFQYVKDPSADPPSDPRGTPFLEYCSLYWGTHMRIELSDRAKAIALALLDRFDGHISAKLLWESIGGELVGWWSVRRLSPSRLEFSALHCISYFGIAELADTLIKMDRWDVNQRDGAGMTPLMWAARHGHEEVVRLLSRKKQIQLDQQDVSFGRTALSWAAGNGHEGVVRLFLGPGFVNPGRIGGRWGKARREAGLLFGRRYINPDSSSKSGRTPLSWAAGNGREGIVKLLLGRKDASPNSSSKLGQTPLCFATGSGHEGIVKLLLKRGDVDPDTPDALLCRTPLSWAAETGREGIVRLLLERKDVNPDSSDKFDRTPLSRAENGHEGIVELLLRLKDVNPDTPDTKYGQTPLSWASENGHEGIAGLLLGRGVVDPDSSSESSRTPLSLAAENGHRGIVKLLLGQENVNPDSLDKFGRTPLSRAAENGREAIVKLLLRQEDINPDTPDALLGRTPLSWAAKNGHEGIVKLLLKREDANPDTPDAPFGRTPLSWAAGNGHEGIVKLLLERADVNPNNSSKSGQTPLALAAASQHFRIVELLHARNSRHIC